MALDKQLIDLSTQSGIDSKSDPNNVAPPALSDLVNMRFDYRGALNPRDRFNDVGAVLGSTSNYVLGLRGVIYAEADQRLYQVAGTTTTQLAPNWSPKATRLALSAGTQATTATVGSNIITVWKSANGFGYQVVSAEGEQLFGRNFTLANISHIHVTGGPADTAYVWILTGGAVITGYSVFGQTVTALTVPALTNISNFSIVYSATDTGFWISYVNATTTFLNKWTVSGSTVSAIGAAASVAVAVGIVAVVRSTNYVVVAQTRTSLTIECFFYTTGLALTTSYSQVVLANGPNTFGAVETSTDTIATTMTPYTTVVGATLTAVLFPQAGPVVLVHNNMSINFVTTTSPMFYRDSVYIAAIDVVSSGFQTHSLVRVIDQGPGATAANSVSSVCFWDSGSAALGDFNAISGGIPASVIAGRKISLAGTAYYIPGSFITTSSQFNYLDFLSSRASYLWGGGRTAVCLLRVSTTEPYAPETHQISTSNVIAASNILSTDGTGMGPGCLWPNFVPLQGGVNSTGSLPDGMYGYVFEKIWYDSVGNIQRLESPPIRLEILAPFSQVKFTIPTGMYLLPNTASNGTTASINVYRTETDGTIPYFLQTLTAASASPFLDNGSQISVSLPLPSSSGEFVAAAPPAIRASTQWKGRIAALVADSDTSIWYTKPSIPYEFVAFAKGLEVDVSAANSPLNAVTTMDGVLYAFNTNQIFTVYGDPAGATGEGGSLSIPELRFNGIGCADPASVIQTPKGIFFKSDKGIYVILRNQELVFIGEGPFVDRAMMVVGSWADKTRSEIGFVTSEGTAWVYDWEMRAWAQWTLPTETMPITGAGLVNDEATFITSAGIRQNSPSAIVGEDIPISVTTGWVKLGSMQGYQRLYNLWLLLNSLADHVLTVDLYIDYNDQTIVKTWVIDSTDLSTTYPEQINLSIPTQKCEAFKLRISSPTPGWKLTGLTAEIGTKPTSYKPRQPHNAY